MVEWLKSLRQHLLTGVSFAIPFIACGGILIALSLAFAPMTATGPDMNAIGNERLRDFLKLTLKIGETSFGLMLPILAGYISYSIAGKPGLVSGMIGGWLSGHLGTVEMMLNGKPVTKDVSAGFLGALAAGLIAGYLVQAVKQIPTHKLVKPIMPILIIPVVSSVIVGALMLLVIGPPIAHAMNSLNDWLVHMQTGNKVVLAMILGAMIAFDMGGPVNKVAFFFASGLIAQGNYSVMGPVAAAICTPPLGMGLATIFGRRLWTTEQRESGYAALGMGTIGITEGAIPFAAGDPLRVIPSIMLGSMVASTIAMLGNAWDHAPHGGLIVLPVVSGPPEMSAWAARGVYVLAILAGVIVTAFTVNGLKVATRSAAPVEP
jgi:fructose-specific phosphotransferase system IIC component